VATATKVTVTIQCTGGKCTAGGNGKITAIGTPTGRAQSLANFTVAGLGAVVTSRTGSTTLFKLPNSIANNATKTFTIGMDFPIEGDSSPNPSGAATAAFLVQVAAGSGLPSGVMNGLATATVFRGLTIAKISDMAFGTVVPPNNGNGTVTLDPIASTVTVTGTGAALGPSSTRTRAAVTINGESGETVTFSVPNQFTMSSGANSLVVTTTTSTTSPAPLSGAPGGPGSMTLGVGGTFPISKTTPFGAYQGTLMITAGYN
jgi:hypothetical protein